MKKALIFSIALLSSLVLHGNAVAGKVVNLNYNDFSSTGGVTLSGAAGQVGNAIQLSTQNVKNVAGGVFFTTPVSVSRFSAEFTFQFSNTFGADGMAFVIKNSGSSGTGPGGLGVYGGGLGYSSIKKSIGIEFDSSINTGNGYNDFDGNHIAIDTNGSMNSLAQSNVPVLFNGTGVWHAWVDYDGIILSVSANQSGVKPGTAMLSQNMDIQSIVGSQTALVGFTAATGSNTQTTKLLSFSESSPAPEPSTYVLMSVGAVIAVITARRKMLSAG
ncbi:MAG: PEP-CTERM sorting domain-containing protein [Chlorobium sp.]|nr:MAG: PEP-CTERM sorting domain-containing protein [Chlorobium sp.]